MLIKEIDDPTQFYDILLKKFNNKPEKSAFILGLAYSLCNDPAQYKDKPILAVLEKNILQKIAIFMTPPWPIVLYSECSVQQQEIEIICDYLIEKKLNISGVNAPRQLSELFSNIWCKKNNYLKEKKIDLILYCLKKTMPVKSTSGFFQIADATHKQFLIEWSEKFNQALQLDMEKLYIDHHVDFVIKNNHAFVWIDSGIPVSMVFFERPFDQGVFIGYVYTPPEHRKKGYATNCVYQVSKYCLETKFTFCSLFTEKNNQTTNHIYQQIGYEPVTEYIFFNFFDS